MGLPCHRLFHAVGFRTAALLLKYAAGRDASKINPLKASRLPTALLLFYDGLGCHRMLQLPTRTTELRPACLSVVQLEAEDYG